MITVNGQDVLTFKDGLDLCKAHTALELKTDEIGALVFDEPFDTGKLVEELQAIRTYENGSLAPSVDRVLEALHVERGESGGHDFRGNQYKQGTSGDAIQGRPVRGGRKEGVDSKARSRIFKQAEKLAAEHPGAHEKINYRIASGKMPGRTFGQSGTTTYAWCSYRPGGSSEIRMNPAYLVGGLTSGTDSRVGMDSHGSLDERTGFHPPGTGNIEGIVTHETAHAYANYAGVNNSDFVDHALSGGGSTNVSAYAQMNAREYIAESYASYKMAPESASQQAMLVGAALDAAVSRAEAGNPLTYREGGTSTG